MCVDGVPSEVAEGLLKKAGHEQPVFFERLRADTVEDEVVEKKWVSKEKSEGEEEYFNMQNIVSVILVQCEGSVRWHHVIAQRVIQMMI